MTTTTPIHKSTLALSVLLFCLCLITAGCWSGCSTTPRSAPSAPSPETTAKAIHVAVRIATRIAAEKSPDVRAALQLAASGIDTLLLRGTYDPASVREQLQKLDVTVEPEVWTAIGAALDVYDVYAAEVVEKKLDTNAYMKPALIALRDGLREGLR